MSGSHSDTIVAIDVSNPELPSRIGFVTDSVELNYPIGLAYDAVNEVLFVACSAHADALMRYRFTVVSVANLSAPEVIGSVQADSIVNPRYVVHYPAEDLVFMSSHNGNCIVAVDVSDPENPAVLNKSPPIFRDSHQKKGKHHLRPARTQKPIDRQPSTIS